VELAGVDWLPLWTENDTAEFDPRREPERRPAIRVISIDRALAQVRAEMAALPDPVPAAQRDRWARLREREALLVMRRAAIAQTLGEELQRTLAPAELATPAAPGDRPTPAAAR
jgi:poly-gamma-glutamate synthesis protein (capsule biosynthesis protein)